MHNYVITSSYSTFTVPYTLQITVAHREASHSVASSHTYCFVAASDSGDSFCCLHVQWPLSSVAHS